MSRKNFIAEYLSDESLEKISKEIEEIEKNTSGEIRVCLKKKRGYREVDFTPREIAINEFMRLGIDKTENKTGVLIFIIFDEHKFEFVADEGINSKIKPEQWDIVSENVKDYFSNEKYLDGILYSLSRIGEVLIREFPIRSDDKNELSNEIIIDS